MEMKERWKGKESHRKQRGKDRSMEKERNLGMN